ncbi:unnamed protein product, partial [Prorocentrum cordatum]
PSSGPVRRRRAAGPEEASREEAPRPALHGWPGGGLLAACCPPRGTAARGRTRARRVRAMPRAAERASSETGVARRGPGEGLAAPGTERGGGGGGGGGGAGGGGGGGKKRDRHADGRPVPGVAPLSGPGPAAPPSTFRPRSASGMHPRPCEEARRKRNAGRIVPQKHGGNGEGNVGWRSASKEIEKKGGRFRPTSEVAQSAADPESGKRHAWPRAQGGMGAQH